MFFICNELGGYPFFNQYTKKKRGFFLAFIEFLRYSTTLNQSISKQVHA